MPRLIESYSNASPATVSCRIFCEYMHRRCLRSVLMRARSSVHWRRNSKDQAHSRGSADGRKRSAWSLANKDFSRIIGAWGEDQANAWPGAIMPALPQLVSSAGASLRSTRTTSWPSCTS